VGGSTVDKGAPGPDGRMNGRCGNRRCSHILFRRPVLLAVCTLPSHGDTAVDLPGGAFQTDSQDTILPVAWIVITEAVITGLVSERMSWQVKKCSQRCLDCSPVSHCSHHALALAVLLERRRRGATFIIGVLSSFCGTTSLVGPCRRCIGINDRSTGFLGIGFSDTFGCRIGNEDGIRCVCHLTIGINQEHQMGACWNRGGRVHSQNGSNHRIGAGDRWDSHSN